MHEQLTALWTRETDARLLVHCGGGAIIFGKVRAHEKMFAARGAAKVCAARANGAHANQQH